MNLPSRYNDLRAALRVGEVSFGCGGIKLFPVSEIGQGQVGYSVAPDGASLCGPEHGAWRPNWTVIGYETSSGEPLFIDTDDSALPVFTAMHGQGVWKPEPVAISIGAFVQCLAEFARVSERRSNPVERDNNPVSDHGRDAYLRRVADLNGQGFDPEFWAVLLEC